MTEVRLSRLKTGEPACAIGSIAYALVETAGGDRVIMSSYEPSGRAVEDIAVDELRNPELGREPQTRESFAAFLDRMNTHHEQKLALKRERRSASTSTPWGQAQGATRYARGVTSYDTARHGGFRLSPSRNERVPEYMRDPKGWYEEDCDWSIVAMTFPDLFTDLEREMAEKTFRNHYPDQFERFAGRALSPGESMERDRRDFFAKHREDYLAIAASRDDDHPGMAKVWATKGGERQTFNGPPVDEKLFLVPLEEYSTRGIAFVIDPERHAPYPEAKPARAVLT